MAATKIFTINGVKKKFTSHSCHDSSGAAKARAVSVRQKQGIKVRVVKSGTKFCLTRAAS